MLSLNLLLWKANKKFKMLCASDRSTLCGAATRWTRETLPSL